ncbi:bifunctional indole-3-glycerol-phosphate synthase TrpC/phosphoribosylanthranilate isomerase TrpF [Thalassotalea fusca]
MTNVLAKIVEDKRVEVAALKKAFPLAEFRDELTPSTKDMYAALTRTIDKPYAGFILECKKASPSKGLIREDFDPVAICQIYNQYAAAISVLTDEKYFQGTYEYLQQVTSEVDCPVLNKDFFIDPYQVYLARYYGADAILLMLSVLTDNEYLALAEIAESLNLAILTEISNEEEKARAVKLGAKMIGINNRNLRDLSTDISRTLDFAPSLPDDVIIISESGIYTNEQVRELAPAVDGFLVGSSIMAQKDIDLACRSLIFGHNKVCGLTSAQAALDAKNAGAVYGGLIFAEKSPRYVTLEKAQEIISTQALNFVGVFVNAPISQVVEYLNTLNLYAVQLHGEESEDYLKELKSTLENTNSECQIWKAQAVVNQVPELMPTAEHIVLDGKNAGSGETFGWRALAESEQDLSRCFLAGGLNSDNIESALLLVSEQQLFGLDLNSGVESQPGVKCREKLNTVFAQIRNY